MRPNLPFLSAASNALLKPGGLLRWKVQLVKDARLSLPLTEAMKIARHASLLLDAPRQSSPRPRLRHDTRLAFSPKSNPKSVHSLLTYDSAPSHFRFTQMVSFPKRYQSYQIGMPPSSGQLCHHQLPLVFPYPSASLRGIFTSPTSHPDSFHSFIL